VLDQAIRESDLLDRKIVAPIEVGRSGKAHADARIRLDEIVTLTEPDRAQSHSDTFKVERARAADGDPRCKVTLSVDRPGMTDRQRDVAIRPRMQAQVELHTGSKTVMQYLLKALYKSRQAFSGALRRAAVVRWYPRCHPTC
jgi:hypothetical protein